MYTDEVSISSEGYLFSGKNPLKGSEIKEYFKDVSDFDSFCKLNTNVNGVYSVFIQFPEEAFLYVSPGGFHKLFYSLNNGTYGISTKAVTLSDGVLNEEVFQEYRASLFCWRNKTLYRNVYAVEPGCAIWISRAGVVRRKIFNYAVNVVELLHGANKGLKKRDILLNINRAIDDMINFLGPHQAVVPLSGGYDSRFILASLITRGYKNIVAVTYGIKNNPEVGIAEKVAKALHVKWYFVEYTEEELKTTLDNLDMDNYLAAMVNGNSFPCMHEIIAISWLQSKGLIQPDAVFIPGHSGDFLGGSQYVKIFPPDLKYDRVAFMLVKKKFEASLFSKSHREQKMQELTKNVIDDYKPSSVFATVFEDVDMSEKLCKHILNAAHAYTYFGYACYFPFWDMNLLNAFRILPAKFKTGKTLYNELLRSEFFEKLKISFENELQPSLLKLRFQNFKNWAKNFLPATIRNRYLKKNDYYLYHQMTASWRVEMENKGFISPGKDYSYNSIIANWVVYKLRNQVSSSEKISHS